MDLLISIFFVAFFYSIAQIYARICLNSKVDYKIVNTYYLLICGFIGLISFCVLRMNNVNTDINGEFSSLFLTSAFFIIGTIFLFYSISKKVNIGILNTIRTALQIILTVLLGYLYFNEKITLMQIIGIILIIVGIFLVF